MRGLVTSPRLGALLATAIAAVLWIIGDGPAGLLYAGLFSVWLAPGLPLGWALFGIGHPGGWLSGAILGYPLSALALWIPIGLGWPHPAAFALCWLLVAALIWVPCWRLRRGQIRPAPWASPEWTALLLVLLIVPALVGRPFSRIGSEDDAGNRRYRAYFTADFVWHMGLTAELEKFESPPRNPYLAGEPLHYYWLYFVPPSVVGAFAPGFPDREARLALNALLTGLLLVSAIYFAAWCGIGRAGPAAFGTALALVAPSAEGLYAIVDYLQRGRPLDDLRDLNVDALTLWHFKSFTIDGLPRAIMYNPQHSFACSAGLVAIAAVAAAGSSLSFVGALAAGGALALALMLSPFPGGLLTLIFGLAALADLIALPRGAIRRAAITAAGALPIGLAFWWMSANEVLEGAGGDLKFGLQARAMAAPVTALALALGPLLVAIGAGLVRSWPLPRSLRPGLIGVTTALVLIFFVSLESADVWVGWRAGQILLVTAPALAAAGLLAMSAGRFTAAGYVVASLLMLAGLPTALLDAYNAQDVENDRMGPGFRWVVSISRQERQALEWIGRHTATDAIVQVEPITRGRDTWTLIPSFAERRMTAGLPISLLDAPVYHARSAAVRQLFESSEPQTAWNMARDLDIDYLYLSQPELRQYPEAEVMLGARPDLFQPVFRNQTARIFRRIE